MEQEYLIPLAKVKEITGATTDEQAAAQITAVQSMIEAYLNVLLIQTNITKEKVTMPYACTSIFSPRFLPINSVSEIKFLKSGGGYAPYNGAFSFDKFAVELAPQTWLSLYYPRYKKGAISAVLLSYNAGLYSDYSQAPALLAMAAEKLLAWTANPDALTGFTSEHLGDYSYTKGALVKGIPEGIAALLNGLNI